MTRLVLLTGGTGTLGREVRSLLAKRGIKVRVLTRDPAAARAIDHEVVEIVGGDARDAGSIAPALAGVGTVISAMSGYGPRSGGNPTSVDWKANCNLIREAEKAGVEHLVLVSAHGAGPSHPMELMRMKFLAELELKRSRMAWTILRPTLYMDTMAMVLGEPLVKRKTALVFGRGNNPINFVAARDVACLVDLSVVDPALRGLEIDVGGPENLTVNQFAATMAAVRGIAGFRRLHVPRNVLRLLALAARPVNPGIARVARDAIVMDTFDMSFEMKPDRVPPTSLAGWLTSGRTT